MRESALLYALSSIAQCAAVLAALIGFLGLWRLDRLREEREQAIQMIYRQLNFSGRITGLSLGQEIALLGDEYFVQKAEAYIKDLERERGEDAQAELRLKRAIARWRDIPGDQQSLLWALRVFLVITLCILGFAIVSFRYVNQATTWPWTPRLLWIVGILLVGSPIGVMWIAARLPRALVVLALLLALASSALAGSVRCLTYEEKSLARIQECMHEEDIGTVAAEAS
jgi:hypothetical protein